MPRHNLNTSFLCAIFREELMIGLQIEHTSGFFRVNHRTTPFIDVSENQPGRVNVGAVVTASHFQFFVDGLIQIENWSEGSSCSIGI